EKNTYNGKVYSLGVSGRETYFVNDIATHNCLVETQLIKEFTIRYMEEYDIDPSNFTEVGYVNELAEIEIFLFRLNMNLAKAENASLIIDQENGATNQGDPIIRKEVSPFMELKDRLQNRRSKIIKLMVGDRQEKYKKESALKVKEDADPSSKMSQMRNRIENLNRQLDSMNQKPAGNVLSPEDLIGQ